MVQMNISSVTEDSGWVAVQSSHYLHDFFGALSKGYFDGITTRGAPRRGLHINTWASLALG